MRIWEHIKDSVQNYLKKIEKSNHEVFGDEVPNCCKLNRNEMNKKGLR